MTVIANFLSFFIPKQKAPAGFIFETVRITSGAPGITLVAQFPAEHVFEVETTLACYSCLGTGFRLSLAPMGVDNPVATLNLKEDLEKSAPYKAVYPLPELGPRANYRQLASIPQFVDLVQMLKAAAEAKSAVKTGTSTVGVLAIASLVCLSTVLFFSGAVNPPASGGTTAVTLNGGKLTALPDISKLTSPGDQLNEVEKQILAKAVSASGIELGSANKGGVPFVVFSDPNCSSCRQLESQLSGMDGSLTPVIVPVSFQRNSADVVSAILCSSDVVQAWKSAASGKPLPADGCEKGRLQAQENNAAFAALKFDRTPTIVTSSGKVAAGVKDFEGLMAWIKANS